MSEKELKELLFSLFEGSDDADEIKNTLRGMASDDQLSNEDYNTILESWEDWLFEWRDEKDGGHPVLKHGNYNQNEEIQLSRVDENYFRLFYEAENYEFFGTKDEVLEELGEHLENKKF